MIWGLAIACSLFDISSSLAGRWCCNLIPLIQNPVQLATESSAWQQRAELSAILSFSIGSRRSKRGCGGGGRVRSPVHFCKSIWMWCSSDFHAPYLFTFIIIYWLPMLLSFFFFLFTSGVCCHCRQRDCSYGSGVGVERVCRLYRAHTKSGSVHTLRFPAAHTATCQGA